MYVYFFGCVYVSPQQNIAFCEIEFSQDQPENIMAFTTPLTPVLGNRSKYVS
jgi:hypothetical protein